MELLDIDGIRKLAKLLQPLQEIADQAGRINSMDQAVAEGEARLEAQREQHNQAQEQAHQRRLVEEANLAEIKAQGANILAEAKAAAAGMIELATIEAGRLVRDAGSAATEQLAEAAAMVTSSKAEAHAQADRALALATQADEAQARLDAIRAAIAQATKV